MEEPGIESPRKVRRIGTRAHPRSNSGQRNTTPNRKMYVKPSPSTSIPPQLLPPLHRKDSLMGEEGIKQLGNLLDPGIIGINVNFNKYGLCHHCKQFKLKELMVGCKYKSSKMGIAIPSSTTVNGTTMYNGKSLTSISIVDINSDNLNALNMINKKKHPGRAKRTKYIYIYIYRSRLQLQERILPFLCD